MNKKNMTVTVYCGSHKGLSPTYTSFAQNFGTQLGKSGYRVAYGGGQLGLMGIIANAALDAGAHVTGIIPKVFVETEQAHYGVKKSVPISAVAKESPKRFPKSSFKITVR